MNYKPKNRQDADTYASGILEGNKIVLSQAITLIESNLAADNALAREVLEKVLTYTGKSLRIGITGVPGVGKSSFIETFGSLVTSENRKLAVLAIDPSSQKSRGSIMGDKTRMEQLAHDLLAYIRPTATGSTLGGVSGKTRETILLCEAAGHEVILVETVGVGQSEIAVHGMVDFFLLQMLAGAGDELQGIKKGIMEMADAIAITKADGENIQAAEKAKASYRNALHLFPPAETGWYPKVTTCSAVENKGISDIWKLVREHESLMKTTGFFQQNRNRQNLEWMHETIRHRLGDQFYQHPLVKGQLKELEEKVIHGEVAAINAAEQLLDIFK